MNYKCIYCDNEATHKLSVINPDDSCAEKKYDMCKEHYQLAVKLMLLYSKKYSQEYVIENMNKILKINSGVI